MPNERARSGGSGKNKSISVIPDFDLIMANENGRGTEAPEARDHFKATYGERLLAHFAYS